MSYSGVGTNSFELTNKLYMKLSQMIYDTSGINLGDNKKELVHARLSKIIRQRNINGFDQYVDILAKDETGEELVSLLDAISTNVTHFFREKQHFDFLVESMSNTKSKEGLKIWSAGCSSGEEPYTLAITLLENFARPQGAAHSILATDISTKVLQRAMRGVYPMKAIESIDRSLVRKYFLKGSKNNGGMVKVKKELANLVTFQRLNLIEPFRLDEEFDVVFCRNVMIYFDSETRQNLTSKFYNSIKPGGYLIIGHSESMNSFDHGFKYVKPTVYRKV